MRKWIRSKCGKFVRWSLSEESPPVQRNDRTYTERTWRFTRAIALLGLFLAIASAVCTVGFILTIWTVHNELVAQNKTIKFDENFDTIASAAAVGRLDIVAMILTFIGVVAAFSIIYGWTAFRSVAIEAAKAETKDRVPLELKSLLNEDGDRLIGLALQDAELLAKIQRGFTAVGIDDTDDADSVDTDAYWDDKGASDDQGNRTATEISAEHSGKRRSPSGKSWFGGIFRRRTE